MTPRTATPPPRSSLVARFGPLAVPTGPGADEQVTTSGHGLDRGGRQVDLLDPNDGSGGAVGVDLEGVRGRVGQTTRTAKRGVEVPDPVGGDGISGRGRDDQLAGRSDRCRHDVRRVVWEVLRRGTSPSAGAAQSIRTTVRPIERRCSWSSSAVSACRPGRTPGGFGSAVPY